jgi:hypothetical protein
MPIRLKTNQYKYHFTGATLRNGDPIPPIGTWLTFEGKIVPCKSGLHASDHPFDALQYAPGNILHRVILKGGLVLHGNPVDKWVGERRKIIASVNAEPMLRAFAREQALGVAHLWSCPDVVRRYLETGDETIRAAARTAARAAAWAAAWAAARAAAWAAARAAARDAAWDAARDAAWAAAWAAAWDAAWDAARTAAWDAARDAAWDAARSRFAILVDELFAKKSRK